MSDTSDICTNITNSMAQCQFHLTSRLSNRSKLLKRWIGIQNSTHSDLITDSLSKLWTTSIGTGSNSISASIAMKSTQRMMNRESQYAVHPATLDGCIASSFHRHPKSSYSVALSCLLALQDQLYDHLSISHLARRLFNSTRRRCHSRIAAS